jgi:hypothetical protein
MICLPVTVWASAVFLGPGLLGRIVAAILIGAIFLGVRRNLPQSGSVRKFGPGLPQHPPPASRLNG